MQTNHPIKESGRQLGPNMRPLVSVLFGLSALFMDLPTLGAVCSEAGWQSALNLFLNTRPRVATVMSTVGQRAHHDEGWHRSFRWKQPALPAAHNVRFPSWFLTNNAFKRSTMD